MMYKLQYLIIIILNFYWLKFHNYNYQFISAYKNHFYFSDIQNIHSDFHIYKVRRQFHIKIEYAKTKFN